MSRVKIEDLKPPAKDLDVKEMKKLFGGSISLNFTSPVLGIGGKVETDGGITDILLGAHGPTT